MQLPVTIIWQYGGFPWPIKPKYVNNKLHNPEWFFVPVLNSCHPVSVAGVKSTEKFTAPYPAALHYIVWILYTNPTIAVLCAKVVRVFTHATLPVHVCPVQCHYYFICNVLTNTCITCITRPICVLRGMHVRFCFEDQWGSYIHDVDLLFLIDFFSWLLHGSRWCHGKRMMQWNCSMDCLLPCRL